MATAVQFKLGNITVNNGESTATISGITNEFFDRGTALFVSGAALPVEATKGSGTSQLALINAWPFASVSNQPFVAFNTIEGLSEAMRLAGVLGEQLAAIVESTSEFSSELLGETNAAGWRSKLGLGSAATRNTGTDPDQVPLNSDLAAIAQSGSAADLIAGLVPNARISETLDAAQAYRRGNILGTVSQSSGVPTGAIIQTITNANGTAVRFVSGLQICFRDDCQASANTNTSFTFPAAFAAATRAVPTGDLAAATAGYVFGSNTAQSSVSIRAVGPAGTVNFSYVAFGFWF